MYQVTRPRGRSDNFCNFKAVMIINNISFNIPVTMVM